MEWAKTAVVLAYLLQDGAVLLAERDKANL
jgi:hypothetical protein